MRKTYQNDITFFYGLLFILFKRLIEDSRIKWKESKFGLYSFLNLSLLIN